MVPASTCISSVVAKPVPIKTPPSSCPSVSMGFMAPPTSWAAMPFFSPDSTYFGVHLDLGRLRPEGDGSRQMSPEVPVHLVGVRVVESLSHNDLTAPAEQGPPGHLGHGEGPFRASPHVDPGVLYLQV